MDTKDINIHSHDPESQFLTMSLPDYMGYEPKEGQKLIVGLHPWDTSDAPMFEYFSMLSEAISDPNVVAIGEIGVDPFHGAPLERQIQLLRYLLFAAKEANMPVVFHIVRRFDILMQMKKEYKMSAAWAVHGFRSKPEVAQQLADAGIYMSVGSKFNPDSVKMIPRNLLLLETDTLPDSEMSNIIEAVAAARGVTPKTLASIARENLRRFLTSGQRSL